MSKPNSTALQGAPNCTWEYSLGSRLIDIEYIPVEQYIDFISEANGSVMAAVFYGTAPISVEGAKFPSFQVKSKQLGEMPMVEVWSSSAKINHGTSSGISFSENGEFIFGEISLCEGQNDDLEGVSQRAYSLITGLIRTKNYPHLLRVWNYFPSINVEEDGMERYKTFCIGRTAGFGSEYKQQHFPAASAVGSDGQRLTICFVASKLPGQNIENPRQVSAYCYPLQYGTQSPSFSRATFHESANEKRLFIAGTASIVGHETKHKGNFEKQLSETLQNIDSVREQVAKIGRSRSKNTFPLSLVKVYLRNENGIDLTLATLERSFDPGVKIILLRGDICRSDLLLEIECIGIDDSR